MKRYTVVFTFAGRKQPGPTVSVPAADPDSARVKATRVVSPILAGRSHTARVLGFKG